MYHSSVVEKRAELADQFPSARPSAGLLTTLEDQTSDYSEQAPDRGMERLDSQDGLVAFSSAMRDLRRQIEQIATTNAPVLLLGELGTGKELVARAIHKLSGRSAGRFMKVNCAAQLSEPLDSGDEAHGFFDAAEDDTLFLHKVTEMPISTQTKLLNLLGEDGPSLPGNAAFCGTHARLISATRENIRKAAESGILRPDLYYRLSVFTLRVPPLRERGSDLPHLLSQLMDTWAEIFRRPRLPITRHIMDVCASYAWPGNLRELENFVKRYLVLGEEKAALDQLESGAENPPETSPGDGSIQITLPVRSGCLDMKSLMRDIKKDAERAIILQALERTRGNKQKAARLLRISLRSLHYKVRAYQVDSMRARDQSRFEIAGPVQHQSASGSASPLSPGSNGKVLTMERALPAAS